MNSVETCDLCGSRSFKFLFQQHDNLHDIPGVYNTSQCNSCKLIFLNPRPTGEVLAKHYPSDKYYSLNPGSKQSTLNDTLCKIFYSKSISSLKKLIFLPLKFLIRSAIIRPSSKILDVGCGGGLFLALMKENGMDCYGVEPWGFNKAFAEQHELKIFQGELSEASYPDNYFDVITMNHVFEHLHNPTETLEELYRILRSGGSLIIAVPQYECLAYKLFGKNWIQLDVPRHLYTFSTNNMKKYARKTGFKVNKVRYNSGPLQFIGSLLYWKNSYRDSKVFWSDFFGKDHKLGLIVQLFFALPLSYLCNIFHTGDQIEVFLTK